LSGIDNVPALQHNRRDARGRLLINAVIREHLSLMSVAVGTIELQIGDTGVADAEDAKIVVIIVFFPALV